MTRSMLGRSACALLVFCLLTISTGCATRGTYDITTMPTPPAPTFRSISVSEVRVGVTTDTLDLTAPVVLRDAIVTALLDAKRYDGVSTNGGADDGTLRIDCTIVDFDRGSQLSRWLIGRFGSKAHLDASCRFTESPSDQLYAEGTFSGEVQGGLFGGSANLERMSKDLASAINRFLQRGR